MFSVPVGNGEKQQSRRIDHLLLGDKATLTYPGPSDEISDQLFAEVSAQDEISAPFQLWNKYYCQLFRNQTSQLSGYSAMFP